MKLFQIQSALGKMSKDGQNPHYKSKYLTYESIMDTLEPILAENKCSITHFGEKEYYTTNVVDLETSETIATSTLPLTELSNPQKVGSAITYYKRYNVGSIFNIITTDDDDGNVASGKEWLGDWITKMTYSKDLESLKKTFDTAYNTFKSTKDRNELVQVKDILKLKIESGIS